MKKKNLNAKLKLAKKTISNLEKKEIQGGVFGDSVTSPCIFTLTNCDDFTCDCFTFQGPNCDFTVRCTLTE